MTVGDIKYDITTGEPIGVAIDDKGTILTRGLIEDCHFPDMITGDMITATFPTEECNIEHNMILSKDDKEVGKLSWDTGKLVFNGNADESALVFFNKFLKYYVDLYIEAKLKEAKK